jgi:hypothetical protein
MTETNEIIKLVKSDPKTKNELTERLNKINTLNKGEKAELATKLTIDNVIYEEAIVIMGEGIKEAEIEIEALEHKNKILEKELNTIDKEKIDNAYQSKKFELQNDNKGNTRVMNRLKSIMSRSKQLTG